MKNQTINTRNNWTLLRSAICILFVMGFSLSTIAQTAYKAQPTSKIKVNGSSNIHDWDMTASVFTIDATFKIADNQLADVTALSFTLPVKNLKSSKDLLNDRAYKALKASQHTRMTYVLTSADVVPAQKLIKANGKLTIAGVTKDVPLQVNYVVNADGSITCKGVKKIKMSDFGVEVPSFMMGAMKTSDDLEIELALNFKK
jgi:polyisoprenoid-binding protein YceI